MIEFVFTMFGMCLVILPVLLVFNYLMSRVSKKTRFDCHLKNVNDKKGFFGIFIAYLNKIVLFSCFIMIGLSFIEKFENTLFLKTALISLVGYLIINYFDNQNEK